jgi:hypothetical protein
MSLGDFMIGVGQGVPTGQKLRGLWDERALTRELSALDQRKREAITPEPGEDGAPGESYYELGGKRYFTPEAPPDYLWEADKLQRQAELYRKRGFQREAHLAEEKAAALAKSGQAEHFEVLAQRARPIFYDDTGRARSMAEIAADPELSRQMTGVMNDPAFDSVRNVNGNYVRVRGVTPLDGERGALDLDVIDPQTGRVIRQGPATEGRSSDPNDRVAALTPEQLFTGMQSHLRGNSPTFAGLDDAARSVAGREGMIRGLAGGGSGLGAAGSGPGAGGGGIVSSLARTESSIDGWGAKNDVPGAGGKGHFGRLQFSKGRLAEASAALGKKITPEAFMADPLLQQEVEDWHFGDIDRYIAEQGLERALGSMINGTGLTLDSMRAVAHLGGKAGLRRYIESGGRYNPADANGTRLSDYSATHAGASAGASAPSPQPAAPSAPRGLGDAAAFAARYPNEMPVASVQRYNETGLLSAPHISSDGAGGQVALDPNTGRKLWSHEGAPQPEGVEVIRDSKGGAVAVGKQSGQEAWRVTAPETPQSESDRLKEQKLRREDLDHTLKLTLRDAYTPEHYVKTLTTFDAMGIDYGTDKIEPILARAIGITKAVEEKNARTLNPLTLLNSGVKFDSYTLGITAAGMGMRASDQKEIAEKLVEPMQAISGGKGMSADQQAEAFRTLAVAQGRFRYTTQQATEFAALNREFGVSSEAFADALEGAGGKLMPDDYAEMLEEQMDRNNAN